jgi:hypothetical protein
MPPKATLAIIILAAVAMPFASGCIYAGGRTVRDVGPQISEQSIAVIEPGKTTADWVTATFGEPSHRGTTADGAEILRYDCDRRTTEGSYVLLLIASSTNTIERTSWWFEIRDGKVARAWGEKCKPICVTAGQTTPTSVANGPIGSN